MQDRFPQQLPRWKAWIQDGSRRLRQREDQIFLVLTLAIGALVGLVVVAFIVLTERLGVRLYPAGGMAWRRVLMPVLGSLILGYLLWRYFPDARGSGVPQTKAALYAREGRITFGTVFGKFFCTSATLACGIPLGREGPSVQVGAGICSVLGRRLGLSPENVKALLPVGAAAAIAAAFNTPLAAVLFTLEEIVGDLHATVLGSVVLASAASWMVLRLVLGNEPLFHVPEYNLVHPAELITYALLGVIGGLVSVAFVKLLVGMREWFLRLPERTVPFHPVAGGLLVGLLGWFVPPVLGVGYGHVSDALNGTMALSLMAGLVLLKLLTVATSYASGNAGGIFGPSLFMGAMLGGTIGNAAQYLLPDYTASTGAYALVGMGAAFAGIVRAPMTSVLMIFETTRDYAIIVPLMISNLISFFISVRFQHEPIYESLSHQDGVHLPRAESRRDSGRRITEVMGPPSEMLRADMSVPEALGFVGDSEFRSWLVGNEQGVLGVINLAKLREAAVRGPSPRTLAELLSPRLFPHVHPDQSVHLALERMGTAHVDILPVVSRASVHTLLGVVALRDIMNAYGLTDWQHVPPPSTPEREV